MTGVVAWAALVLALAAWLLLAGAVVLALRFWRKVEPQVSPVLAMFAPPKSYEPGSVNYAFGYPPSTEAAPPLGPGYRENEPPQ